MARSGLTKSQVREARDRLLAEGRHPSVDAVRHALGDSGSKSTIHKYLKELRSEDGGGDVTPGLRRDYYSPLLRLSLCLRALTPLSALSQWYVQPLSVFLFLEYTQLTLPIVKPCYSVLDRDQLSRCCHWTAYRRHCPAQCRHQPT